ncbi:hypothetical protein DPX16_15790 [Anabarilius grahami]|uniref:Uncharacterized protein n=1 Tax=Anabarilius grahami TaxID=495550 RepID=A0A3N0YTE5_ANAGA|nr:hypothetical protein DPX16_15790 [Anabarilius grahami]
MIMFSVRDGVYGSGALRESHPWRGKRKSGGGRSDAQGPHSQRSLCLFALLPETDRQKRMRNVSLTSETSERPAPRLPAERERRVRNPGKRLGVFVIRGLPGNLNTFTFLGSEEQWLVRPWFALGSSLFAPEENKERLYLLNHLIRTDLSDHHENHASDFIDSLLQASSGAPSPPRLPCRLPSATSAISRSSASKYVKQDTWK